jgi:putative membrane protein
MAEDTTLRDELARDRTALANERTLLSYSRTALGLVALAVLIFKFSPTALDIGIGICALAAAGIVFAIGLRSFRSVSSKIHADAAHSIELAFERQKS